MLAEMPQPELYGPLTPHLHARYAGIIGRLAIGGQWKLRGELPQDVGTILQRRALGYLGRR